MIDQRGNARVGRAQHRARALDGAHGADLLVLLGRNGAPVPGIVGDVDQQCRLRQLADNFAAECIFVADIDGDALPGDDKRLLIARARRLIGERDVQYLPNEPTYQRLDRNGLAKRHQVMLAIHLRRRVA